MLGIPTTKNRPPVAYCVKTRATGGFFMQFTQLLAQIGQTSLTALLSIVVLFI